ncbi:hypothetical protein BAE44_0001389 [Dichanthelium oligosanthes]|uniref:Cathepsin propeptide inhibitor domain-containing protein n=1 Tax=Dichanthelium oligosanthes TaxID=888268 RepID=A0A1E5WJR1_9POAL|nr:hypothetical protein BAE44_0001389 [Dichanthelium oligosanthes]
MDQEEEDDDQAMRARFEDWMEEYGRRYQDEEEKARRFKIFKSVARNPKIEKAPLAIIHKLGANLEDLGASAKDGEDHPETICGA